MGLRHRAVDLRKVKLIPVATRGNKTELRMFGKPIKPTASAREFFEGLPQFLKAADLREFMDRVFTARRADKPFHLLLGAHTIKVGLAPLFIDLMEQQLVTGVSFNGAGLIHDLELAFFGGTSEDVQAGLADGTFGMARETGELYAAVVALADREQLGLGHATGLYINRRKARYRRHSIFAAAQHRDLPATIHVGIGTDIVAQQPIFDAAAVAAASYRDFLLLCDICRAIDRGGVLANIGSAVILPEVFLKALTVARNLHPGGGRLTTANFDMIDHYRPRMNVVARPTALGGKGFSFVGHHELLVPLLAWGLKTFRRA